MKKKKISKIILSLFISLSFFSCQSAPKDKEKKTENKTKQNLNENIEIQEENTASDDDEVIIVEESEAEKFISSLENIKLKIESAPAAVNLKRSFTKAFSASVKDSDGNPIANYSVDVSYPSARKAREYEFSTVTLLSDSNGLVTFTAPQTSFPASSKVTFYPTPFDSSEEVLNAVGEKAVSADYLVKSDIVSRGAVLFIWDYNEKNRPVTNSYDVQAEFRSRGITMVGNGPVNETSYIGKPQTLYKETYEIIGGNTYGYLIYGSVKFEEPVTPEEDGGYSCTFKSEISAVAMKNGENIYNSVLSYKSKGKNWNECVSNGKAQIAKLIVSDILYNL